MSTFSNVHSLIYGLLSGNSTTPLAAGDVARALVQAVYNRVKAVAPTNASQVRHSHCENQGYWWAATPVCLAATLCKDQIHGGPT